MHPDEKVYAALYLVGLGLNDCQISRAMGIPRSTVREWRHGKRKSPRVFGGKPWQNGCPFCAQGDINAPTYAQLLGLYLGDGYISQHPRAHRLRISLDQRYPAIISEGMKVISAAFPSASLKVGSALCEGYVEVYSYWQHWPCVFPQHGSGPKHMRPIELERWQEQILEAHPERLLRGLIHSDGWRGTNRVTRLLQNGARRYEYPRYQFCNHSGDIQAIFCRACDAYGIRWRKMRWNAISIARREDVAKLDLVIGPKK
jgi:hypothetical protein